MNVFKRFFTKTEIDLTTGNLFKKLILFAIPIILTSVLQLLYTSADLIIVKIFSADGENSSAAIGSNGALINLIINTFVGLSVGANVAMGNAKGANDKERGEKILHSAMIISLISGLFCLFLGIFFARNLLEIMSTQIDLIDKATDYLKIYFIGAPFLMIYNFGSAIMRALGDSSKPLIILLISGLINVLFNIIFTYFFNMDVSGVGWATVISEAVSAALVIFFLFRSKIFVKLSLKKIRLYKTETLEIIKIGIPAGLQSLIFSISNVLIQSEVNILGADNPAIIAGSTGSNNIESYVMSLGNGITQGVVSMTSQNYGAKNIQNIKKTFYYGLILSTGIVIIGGLLSIALAEPLLKLFTETDAALKAGKQRLYIMTSLYFTQAIMSCCSCHLQGMKYTMTPAIITLFGCVILRIVYIYTIYRMIPELQTLSWLYATYPISWAFTDAIYFVTIKIVWDKTFKKLKKSE